MRTGSSARHPLAAGVSPSGAVMVLHGFIARDGVMALWAETDERRSAEPPPAAVVAEPSSAAVVAESPASGTGVLRAAHDGDGVLVGRLGLTDEDGGPRCARVRPPDVRWLLE
jgi:hypothetical protein